VIDDGHESQEPLNPDRSLRGESVWFSRFRKSRESKIAAKGEKGDRVGLVEKRPGDVGRESFEARRCVMGCRRREEVGFFEGRKHKN